MTGIAPRNPAKSAGDRRNQLQDETLPDIVLSQRNGKMPEDLSRKEEQRGTRNIMMWGVAIAAVLFVALIAGFVLVPDGQETSSVNRATEQNSGANAPLEQVPPAGTHEDGYGNSKLPEDPQ